MPSDISTARTVAYGDMALGAVAVGAYVLALWWCWESWSVGVRWLLGGVVVTITLITVYPAIMLERRIKREAAAKAKLTPPFNVADYPGENMAEVAEAIDLAVERMRAEGMGATCMTLSRLCNEGAFDVDICRQAQDYAMLSICGHAYFSTYYRNKHGLDVTKEEIHQQRLLHMTALANDIRGAEVQ